MKKKHLRVKFTNGETYDIPAEFIARKRAEYYVEKDREQGYTISEFMKSEIEEEMRSTLGDDRELTDWAFNNMEWIDVRGISERVASSKSINYGREWGSETSSEIISK